MIDLEAVKASLKHEHSIYTRCFTCFSWGINIPGNKLCGNCNSSDTIIYYPEECLSQLAEANKEIERLKKELENKNV